MEDHSAYAYKLRKTSCTLNNIRALQCKEIAELNEVDRNSLFAELDRGVDIVTHELQMCMYMYAYGNMHKAKLYAALEQIHNDILGCTELAVVDYGCGQGIGTLCLVDYMKANGYDIENIKSVTLIEPSKVSIERAELHISLALPHAKIISINKKIDEIQEKELTFTQNNVVHVLSNILDVENINLKHLAQLTKNQKISCAEYICVGPYFGETAKQKRYDDFGKYIEIAPHYRQDYPKGTWKNEWTCSIRLYSYGTCNLGDTLTKRNSMSLKEAILNYGTFEFFDHQIIKGKECTFCKLGSVIAYPSAKAQNLLRQYGEKAIERLKYIEMLNDGKWVKCILTTKSRIDVDTSAVKEFWSLMDFARKMGQPKRAIINTKDTEQIFAALMFPTPNGESDYTMVYFGSSMDELSVKEIISRKNDLYIIQRESGKYYLFDKEYMIAHNLIDFPDDESYSDLPF